MNLYFFNTEDLYTASQQLLAGLGITLYSDTETTPVQFDNIHDSEIKNIYFAGMITEINGSAIEKEGYDNLLFYSFELNQKPTRSIIAELCRKANMSTRGLDRPIALILKYGHLISFAIPERFIYLQEWRQRQGGEKIGKIIILKDIDTQDTHAAHLKILYGDNTGKFGLKIRNQTVTTFNDLCKYWQVQFSLQALNKAFYEDLQKWFYYAKIKIKLPPKPEHVKTEDDNNKNFLVRLLARTMFCWFIKEKEGEIIRSELLELTDYKGVRFKLTNDVEDEYFLQSNSYYRGILQNIFFKSLNEKEKKSSKDFKWTKYLHPDFDFSWLINIPYLNGGIFDKLEEDYHKESYEDAVIKIPNFLFYGNEEQKGLPDNNRSAMGKRYV
jgi:hypothetical protein